MLVQQFAQGRERAAHRFSACSERVVDTREIIPINVVHSRFQQNVRITGPAKLVCISLRIRESVIEYFHFISRG